MELQIEGEELLRKHSLNIQIYNRTSISLEILNRLNNEILTRVGIYCLILHIRVL